nr:heparan-alpha-glucosaminide N-acetyltransferase domain-containing protein [Myxococcota bacterium]
PIFLFSSGMAFGVTTLGKWDEHTHFGRAVLKRFERYAILLGIGYLLQVGDLGLRYMLELPIDRLHRATAVNALQLIGVVLAFAEAMVLVLRRPPLFLALMGFAMFGAVLAAPWTWDLALEGWPVPVAAYVSSTTRSLFPIFPWAGFLLAGILVARFVRGRRKSAKPGLWQLVIPLALASATLVLLGKSAPFVGDPFPDHNVWKAGPFFFVFRLGVVLGLLAVLCAIDLGISRLKSASSSRAITLLQTLGAETLVVYVAHLLMIYGVFGLPGLKDRFPKNLGLGESIALVVAVFGTMVAFAWLWHETKKRHPKAFDRVRYALMALVVIVFFAR